MRRVRAPVMCPDCGRVEMLNELDLRWLVGELQKKLGVSVECGSLTLNFNQGEFQTYDVKGHYRAPKDLTPQKVVDGRRQCV